MSVSTVLAKALFDNTAESPEELAFRKGDILMVLEREQSGGPGWWLCSLHGRQGIAPANRLRLLQTAPGPAPEDSVVYLSPGSPLADGLAPRPGEFRNAEGGRPRSHSSSGARPRPDWDIAVAGRPRSPSLRGRGTDATGALYQSPVGPVAAAKSARQPAALLASESVYLSPASVPRAAEPSEDATYLVPRESASAEVSEDCYLVPKGTPLASDEVYQSPTGGAVGHSTCSSGSSGVGGASKSTADTPGMYQTPTNLPRTQATVLAHQHPSQILSAPACSRPPQRGAAPVVAVARGKPNLACHRGSPLLVRAGHIRVPGSPGFTRKPPPPAPPVRGVTRKEASPAAPPPREDPRAGAPVTQQNPARSDEAGGNGLSRKTDPRDQPDMLDDQVYDTPPSSRWQRLAPPALGDANGDIYDTPRSVPPLADSGSEVYDVPTITLNLSDIQPEEGANAGSDDVYSVPSLPGVPQATAQSVEAAQTGEAYRARSSGGGGGGGSPSEPDCGIYDLPAPTAEGLPHSLSSSSASTCAPRRLSVSSTGSGDLPWRASLCGLVHSVLSAASGPSPAPPSRDLAASLAEILSAWRASHAGDPPPPLQQAWARLSDLLPALSAAGAAAPPEGLLLLVQRSLEESTLLLQAQGRPRLPSQESLSRRPLPALPGADGKASASGMGSRKGSWIQERPLPPTPLPSFPLNPAPSAAVIALTAGGEDELGNEYAGIGLTPVPAPLPTGDSVGYVKLQGKPEPPPDAPTENGQPQTISAEQKENKLALASPPSASSSASSADATGSRQEPLAPSPGLPASLSLEDSELLSFYSSQSLAHLSCLADAIDALYGSVQGNQPPRVFVARGKSLIVTAHKLVFIGDTLSRLLTSPDLRAKITTSGGHLCQALKTVVVATKGAAQNYPSVSATQEMVDRVAELSQQAAGFSTLLQRLAET